MRGKFLFQAIQLDPAQNSHQTVRAQPAADITTSNTEEGIPVAAWVAILA